MAILTIRRLDEKLLSRLRIRAARHGRSMEEEAEEILRLVLITSPSSANLTEAIRKRFLEFGGVDLELPHRKSHVAPSSINDK